MAIVQISKILHRTGANLDLPQLDTGELGFATDERRLYIGNDPVEHPAQGANNTTQTEILTDQSLINEKNSDITDTDLPIKARISGLANSVFGLSNFRTGQLLVGNGTGITANTVVNWNGNKLGSNSNVRLTLGNVSNISITGGMSGGVLSTDGAGNLTWTSLAASGGGLPSQATKNGNVLTTDGTTAGWSNVYADARFATGVRGNISVANVSGDGSISYNSSNGVISYTGPNATEVISHFSNGTGVTIASNGQVSIGQNVSTSSDVTFANISVEGITGNTLTAAIGTDNPVVYVNVSKKLSTESDASFTYNSSTNTLTVGKLEVGTTANIGTLFKAPLQTKASGDPGDIGQICWDANYIYVCTSGSSWKRVALSSF